MKDCILVIRDSKSEKQIPLNKERIVLGRDPSCDVILEGSEFSRQHIAIHYRFDSVYIENISSMGELKIQESSIEYAQLREGVEAIIGPYTIKWITGELSEAKEIPLEEEKKAEETSHALFGEHSESENASHINIINQVDMPEPDGARAAQDEVHTKVKPLAENVHESDIALAPEMLNEFAEDKTVTQIGGTAGLLRILSGEIIGREIRLEHGKEWTIGRAKEADVTLDNAKVSRHHFKIIQIGSGFRVQDLDSSYGVKINGVAIKDAPLKSFDSISIGPVEIQFMIVDRKAKALGPVNPPNQELAVINPGGSEAKALHNEKTQWIPAVNVTPAEAFKMEQPPAGQGFGPSKSKSQNPASAKDQAKKKIAEFKAWYKTQPRPRQILLLVLPLLILLGIFATLLPQAPTAAPVAIQKPVDKKDAKAETNAEQNAADSSDVSPEFQLKSPKEKAEIQHIYTQAEEARGRGDWQMANDKAQEILNRVGKYKRVNEIIAEAQGYLTDLQIATLSRADKDSELQATNNGRKVEDLLKQGEKALNEKRWDDAKEIFTKALILDPKNDKATRGQYAAESKNPAGLSEPLAIERTIAQDKVVGEDGEAPVTLESMSQDYQGAKQKIQEGAFRDAFPILKQLKQKIEQLIADEEANRNPANAAPGSAVVGAPASLAEDSRNLRSKIIESLDLVNNQFVIEYKTQLDDAQQAIANQKYVEARAIYDTIIKREPYFEEPRTEREKLYRKMVADGQSAYREGLVAESVGDLDSALELYEKAKSYFENIDKKEAEEYYATLDKKMRTLRK